MGHCEKRGIALSRREALTAFCALGLQVLAPGPAIQTVGSEARRHYRNLLVIHNDGGGPAGPDSFDVTEPSPNIDRPFRSIPTSVAGTHFTELFPELAKRMKKMVLLRNRPSTSMDHTLAIAASLARSKSGENLLSRVAGNTKGIPEFFYAETPDVISASDYRKESFSVGRLSLEARYCKEKRCYELPLPGGVDVDLLLSRRRLLSLFESPKGRPITGVRIDEYARHAETAFELLTKLGELSTSCNPEDLKRYSGGGEPTPVSCGVLLLRDCVKKGIIGAGIFRNGYSDGIYGGFDNHTGVVSALQQNGPRTDCAISALIDDWERGVLGDAVIVVNTEFGRTPRINSSEGRDHWETRPGLLIGSAFQAGAIIGATDKEGKGVHDNGEVTDQDHERIVLEALRPESERGSTVRDTFPIFR